jgi:protein TonB
VNLPPDVEKPKDFEMPASPEPPAKVKETLGFSNPVFANVEDITEKNEMKSMDELSKSGAEIASKTMEGSPDPDAISIDELDKNNIIGGGGVVEEEIILVPDQPALFKGGLSDMYTYISKNLRYPAIAADNGVFGTATVRFVVNKDGSISNVELLKGFDRACDNEAMRVIKSMPTWQAGRVNGNPVRSYFTIPIKFILTK